MTLLMQNSYKVFQKKNMTGLKSHFIMALVEEDFMAGTIHRVWEYNPYEAEASNESY
jgi:hypothetical protein